MKISASIWLVICLISVTILELSSVSVWANIAQAPYITPIGESEAFRANTGVAASGSSGAAFYNPGALTTVGGTKVSFSGAAYMFFDLKTDGIAQIAGTDLGYEAQGYQSIPFSVLSAVKSSDQFYYGFSIIQPGLLTLQNKSLWGSSTFKMSMIQDFSDTDTWLGPTAAWKMDPKLSVGATLYFAHHSESQVSAANASVIGQPNTIVDSSSKTQLDTWAITVIAGAFYHLDEKWDLGLRLRTPSLQFSGKGSYYKITQTVNNGAVTTTENANDDVDGKDHFPLDLTFGAAYKLDDRWTFFADLGWQSGDSFQTSSDTQLGSLVEVDPTVRLNLGANYKFADAWTASGGLFLNPRTNKDLSGDPDGTTTIDYYDVSGGVMYISDKITAGVGLFYIWGNGSVVQSTTHALKSMKVQTYGAMLTSGYQF